MSKFTKTVSLRFTEEQEKMIKEVMASRKIFKLSDMTRELFQEEYQRINAKL